MFQLTCTIQDGTNVSAFAKSGVHACLFSGPRFGVRAARIRSLELCQAMIQEAHAHNMQAYILCQALVHNDQLESLRADMRAYADFGVDGLFFADPAVYQIVREEQLPLTLHWHGDAIMTNAHHAHFWRHYGVASVTMSRELTLAQMIALAAAYGQWRVQIYGPTPLFYSRRFLQSNYYEKIGAIKPKQAVVLYEAERDTEYPIMEDEAGTHIFSPRDICLLDVLFPLYEAGIQSFLIDGVWYDDTHMCAVARIYTAALHLLETPDQFRREIPLLQKQLASLSTQKREIDSGFLYKPTIYKKEKGL